MTPEKDNSISIKRLSNETEYYTNVFKKTEKIVSVVFYILSQTESKKDTELQVSVIKDRALKTHEELLRSLRLQTHEVVTGVRKVQYVLVDLESTLRIAEAAGVIPSNIAHLLYEQLVGVQRYLMHNYLQEAPLDLGESLTTLAPMRTQTKQVRTLPKASGGATRRRSVSIPAGDISSDAYFVYSKLTDRSDRIKTVLEAKPHATIRDIAEIITDVSEKTIQRELNSLIEKGQVVREGERRWSRYSVQK